MKKIEQFYQETKYEMTPNNIRQARVFKDSKVLNEWSWDGPGISLNMIM